MIAQRRLLARIALVASLLLVTAQGADASGNVRGGKRTALETAAAAARAKKKPPVKRTYKRGLPHISRGSILRLGGNRLLADAEYVDLRDSVKELLTHFPPDQNYFVGLGRDPTPIIGFLQNLAGEQQAMNFPGASGKGWGISHNPDWKLFEAYFSKYFPRDVLEGTRDIVLIDQTNSGTYRAGTLAQFSPFVERYLEQVGFKGKLKLAAFSAQAQPAGTVQIDTTNYPEVAQFLGYKYEGVVSEYPRNSIGYNSISEIKRRPAYQKFRAALLERMQRDVDLDAFVITTYGLRGKPASEKRRPTKPWLPTVRLPAPRGAAPGDGPLMTVDVEARRATGIYWNNGHAAEKAERFTYLDPVGYRHVRDGALRLMRKYSPDKHYLVGVGRSTTAYTALMDSVGRDIGAYMPIVGEEPWSGREPATATRAKYHAMFDQVLPRRVLTGGRTIVLYQRAQDSNTVEFMQSMVKEFLEGKGSDTKVEVVLLHDSSNTTSRYRASIKVPTVDVSRSKELRSMNTRKYEAVAPYGDKRGVTGRSGIEGAAFTRSGKLAARSRAYTTFQRHMSERVAHDPTIAAELARVVSGTGK